MKQKARDATFLVVVTGLFILMSYFTKHHLAAIEQIPMINSLFGEFVFVLVVISEVVFAPTSVVPLLPFGVNVWGLNTTIVLTTFGWTAGSLIAFSIARTFGRRVVSYFIKEHHISAWSDVLPEKELFAFLILARIFLPIDMVSYAVGIFTRMSWLDFLLATFIGSAISATIFSFGAGLPLLWQAIGGIIMIIFIIFYYERFKRNFKKLLS